MSKKSQIEEYMDFYNGPRGNSNHLVFAQHPNGKIKQLSLKYPQKSSLFASQIELIDQLIDQNNK